MTTPNVTGLVGETRNSICFGLTVERMQSSHDPHPRNGQL